MAMEEKNRICPACGAENPEDNRFCEACGCELQSEAAAPAEESSNESSAKSLSKKKKLLIGVVLGVLVVAAGVVGVVKYLDSKTSAEYNAKLSEADNYLEEQEYDKAETAYLQAIDIEPKKEKAYLQVADVYVTQKRYEDAEQILQKGQDQAGGKKIRTKLKQVQPYGLYDDYLNDTIVPDIGLADLDELKNRSQLKEGLVSAEIRDFNKDEIPDMLTVAYADDKITITLYTCEDDEVTELDSVEEKLYLSDVEAICLNVYPDDSTEEGKYLRLKQEYFFVCAGVHSIVETHLKNHPSLDNLGEKVAIQLNDTHPVLVIPELMRVLMDEYSYAWDKAWQIVKETVSYTNHTVMAEALEKWPMQYIENLLPRIAMIISEIDRRYCAWAWQQCPDDPDLVSRTRPLRDGTLHMAALALIGSHAVNGVAGIHTEILKNDLFRDQVRLYPDLIQNKTNGVTTRRWLMYCNPELRKLLDDTIGTAWEKDYHHFEDLLKYVDDPSVQEAFLDVKQVRKEKLAAYVRDLTGEIIDPSSMIDTQAKRLHAYKRQLLNIMQVIYLYQRMKRDPSFRIAPHTYLFAAKAASSYTFAKSVIKLINCVAAKINNDPDTRDVLKVVFLPNYCVTMAETLVPGSDVSEQISTAGKEASGTGNMKFMMNGAITLGTLDGANVEIDSLVGRDNDVIFGHTVEELNTLQYHYNAYDYYQQDGRIHDVLDTLINGFWNGSADEFRIIYDELITRNDTYFVLADFDAYVKAQEEIARRYASRNSWARSCLVNIARSGYFSSDRTIEEYAHDIWDLQKLHF